MISHSGYMRAALVQGIVLLAVNLTPVIAAAGSVTVKVSGLQGTDGMVRCALFDARDGFPMVIDKARATASSAIEGSVEECRFEGLARADYAIATIHDQNANGKLDTNMLGIPEEGWGVSQQQRPAGAACAQFR